MAVIKKGLDPKVVKEYLISFLAKKNYAVLEEKFEGQNKDTLKIYLQKLDIPDSPNTAPAETR